MKTSNTSAIALVLGLITLISPFAAYAHCPAHGKTEKVCVMFDENTVYIYDEKLEHNGPYKDLKGTLKISDTAGKALVTKKLAKGVYKIESKEIIKTIVLEIPEKITLKEEHKH